MKQNKTYTKELWITLQIASDAEDEKLEDEMMEYGLLG